MCRIVARICWKLESIWQFASADCLTRASQRSDWRLAVWLPVLPSYLSRYGKPLSADDLRKQFPLAFSAAVSSGDWTFANSGSLFRCPIFSPEVRRSPITSSTKSCRRDSKRPPGFSSSSSDIMAPVYGTDRDREPAFGACFRIDGQDQT
jgi:hypothetical protein